MGLVPEKNFEYKFLDDTTRTIIWQRTTEIKELMRLTAENIISIGQKLTEVKENLGHGSFQNWLKTEFEWSEQTARQFMQVYRWSETIRNKNFVFSQLPTSALYLLAAPSTPPEARDEILSLVDRGEKVSYTSVKIVVNRCKQLLPPEYEVQKTVDISAQNKVQPKLVSIDNRLFRLKTANLGYIVRLYQVDEMEKITDLTVGAAVKIKVGRWSGQTATIAEILNEQQSVTNGDRCSLNPNDYKSVDREDLAVYLLKNQDLPVLDKPPEQHSIVSYGNVRLAIEGNRQLLSAFILHIQNNFNFVTEIFERALNN